MTKIYTLLKILIQKAKDGVKIEKEDNFNLNDVDIDLQAVLIKCISLGKMCNDINSTFLV